MSLEEHKRRERVQAIGLFRYQLICPALEAGLSTKQRGRLVREIAQRTHVDPFGTRVQIARPTLDRWIRRYRAGGFEALVPEPRRLATRTDVGVLELAASLKRENPSRTTAQVARILRTATGWAPSESTLLRHFHRCELMGPPPVAPGRCSAGSKPPTPTNCGSATLCTVRGSVTARPTCSPSSTTILGWWSVTGSGSPRTPCVWRPRSNPRWPPAACQPRFMSTMVRRSSMPGCCGRARNSVSDWYIRRPGARRTGQD
ncbi:hypothetical protein MPHO_40050 [Mycolicibacterium phocaicum]|nr:hypothetical protein MPHO_40050 [Mycolicibacterium phocaicum]